jgi:hypothetical protein
MDFSGDYDNYRLSLSQFNDIEVPYEFTLYSLDSNTPLTNSNQINVLEQFKLIIQQAFPICLNNCPLKDTRYSFVFYLERLDEIKQKKVSTRMHALSFKFRIINTNYVDSITPRVFPTEDFRVLMDEFLYGVHFEILFDDIKNKFKYTWNFLRITLGSLALNCKIRRMKLFFL